MLRLKFLYYQEKIKDISVSKQSCLLYTTAKALKLVNFRLQFLTTKYLTHVAGLRPHYRFQMSYKHPLRFLNRKYGSTQKLSSHLMRNGKLLLWVKFFKIYYMQLLRTNFLVSFSQLNQKYRFLRVGISFFWPMYYFYNAIKDFDRIIIWRLFQVNSLFRFHVGIYRRRGRKKQELKISFVMYEQRIYVTWRWLVFYFRGVGTDLKKKQNILHALEQFILQPPRKHPLTLFKYEVYRAQLLRMV